MVFSKMLWYVDMNAKTRVLEEFTKTGHRDIHFLISDWLFLILRPIRNCIRDTRNSFEIPMALPSSHIFKATFRQLCSNFMWSWSLRKCYSIYSERSSLKSNSCGLGISGSTIVYSLGEVHWRGAHVVLVC